MAHAIAQIHFTEKYGPYGSQCPENYNFQVKEGEHIKEVIIRHGYIVDAIGFVVAKPCGETCRNSDAISGIARNYFLTSKSGSHTSIANGVPHIVFRGSVNKPGLAKDESKYEVTAKHVLKTVAQFVDEIYPRKKYSIVYQA